MSSGIIESAIELRQLYLRTNIEDAAEVQAAIKEVSVNAYAAGKEQYLEALNAANAVNIKKARRFQSMPPVVRYLGWGVIAIFFICAMAFDDSGLFEESSVMWPYIGCWVGIIMQIYIAVQKSAWKKLTLSGSVIHPALTSGVVASTKTNVAAKMPATKQKSTSTSGGVFCGECGRRNKEGAEHCENCGAELKSE